MFYTSEQMLALKDIAKLKAEQVFVRAEIEHFEEIIKKNVMLYKNKENFAGKEEVCKILEELHFKNESITQEIYDKEKIFFY